MRQREKSLKPLNIGHRQRRVHRRLGIRRIKIALLGRMPVSPQRHVKRLLDVRHRAGHVQQQPVAVCAGDSQAVRSRKIDYRLVILFRRAELFRELFRRQILVKIRAGRVIKLLEKIGRAPPDSAAAARWPDADGLSPAGRPVGCKLQTRHRRRHVTVQNLSFRREAWSNRAETQSAAPMPVTPITTEIST